VIAAGLEDVLGLPHDLEFGVRAVPNGLQSTFELFLEGRLLDLIDVDDMHRDFAIVVLHLLDLVARHLDLVLGRELVLAGVGEVIRRILSALRTALPDRIRLHLLGFGKIEELSALEEHHVTSFDTTSPLLRAFKDARKNYWVRTAAGDLSYYTAIRIPQATENNKLKHKAREGTRLGLPQSAALHRCGPDTPPAAGPPATTRRRFLRRGAFPLTNHLRET
jgi:hypothetical protein